MKNFTLLMTILLMNIAGFSQQRKKNAERGTDSSLIMSPSAAIKLWKEPKFYLTVHSGYAVALGSTFKFYPDDITNIMVNMPSSGTPTKTVTSKAMTKGLGEGFRYGAGLSYVVNDFINVGIDFDYFQSTISKVRDSSFHQVANMPNGISDNTLNESYVISYEAKLLTISPNITFKAISRPKFFIYNKIGAILTFRPNSIQRETQNDKWTMGWQGFFRDSSSTTSKRYEWGIQNPALGFMGAIGAQVKLSERVRVFTEIQFSHILFVVHNRVLTSLNVDGQEEVNTQPLSAREVDFKKSFTNDEFTTDPNKPMVSVTQRFPLTYVGLQAGLAYRF